MKLISYEVYWDESHYTEVEANDEETAWDIARQRNPDETYCGIVGDIQVIKDRPQTEISDEIGNAYHKDMEKYVEINASDYEMVYYD